MKTQSIKHMNRNEIKDYLFCIQNYFKESINNGTDIDDMLDNTTILDEFEEYLPEEEYPIFVITILNGFKTDSIIKNILDSIEKKKALNVSN